MDKTVENGFKCGLCPRRLASKYSLERHIKLKHKSTSPETKKQKLENNNNVPKLDVKQASDIDSDQESDNNSNVDRKQASDNDSDQESDNNSDLDRNNKNIVYANNAGWVETDNKEEIDKSESEESNIESSDNNKDNIKNGESELDNNEESDNNKEESDNSENEESTVDMEETNNNASVKDLDYKHDLFDIVETSKEMRDRFKHCGVVVTFRIKPPPVHISRPRLYLKWMVDLFKAILEYLAPKYSPEPEDFVSFDFFHADTNTIQWMWPRKRKELNVGHIVSTLLTGNIANPSGHLTIALNCRKAEITCLACGHTRVNKYGMSYTD